VEYRFLELETGVIPVEEYLIGVGADRGTLIIGRLGLLDRLDMGDPLPDPPFSLLLEELGVFQLLVDYDNEVHRVALCEHQGHWILIDAFRCDTAAIPDADLARVLEVWRKLDKS
jgi:hypothetical protein